MSTSIVKCRTQAQITPLGVDCENTYVFLANGCFTNRC